MLAEIKKQFYETTVKELEDINIKLSHEEVPVEDHPVLTEQIFTLTHQISGTGPMLGFDGASKLSRKLERTFYDIRAGQRNLTPQLIWQTKRAIEVLIQTFVEENSIQRQ
ncbi:Hpt domain-containing protein [Alkaliflexus imshenetskii]|jgi:chemotaxis protein histidine kinase CheA|uniref:Hpt domain-containing protein n=1 Tax=Alkaliflexus imshenetskii TaxID=286730 RepID=UPI0004B8F58A|nr:Hpt domain-containing protein [Alkaliflexus imshenetskii]